MVFRVRAKVRYLRESGAVSERLASIGGMDESTTPTTTADHGTTDATPSAPEPATHGPVALTIREAAATTGLTRTAIRGRVERGSLRSVVGRDGKRRIPRSELERAGLIDHVRGHDGDTGVAGVGGTTLDVASMDAFVALLESLQAQSVALTERAVAAETRLQLEQRAASSIEDALHEARAELAAERERAEALRVELAAAQARRRWFRRRGRD